MEPDAEINPFRLTETPVTTTLQRAWCMCGGQYLPTGQVSLVHPPQYPHACTDCDDRRVFPKKYPDLIFTEVPSA